MTSLNNRGGARNPRLALSIPGAAPAPSPAGRPGLPQLRLATPAQGVNIVDGRRPSQTANQYVALGFAMGLKTQVQGSPDNTTGGGSKEASRPKSDIDQSTLDVEDLDDEGWKIAREQERIVELGSLGEGAGGAVTKCQLKGGRTVFAMKIITTDPSEEVKKQIMRELNFNKECSSSYICKYYGAFIDLQSATISIAMEFCEGGSLDSIYRMVKSRGGRTGEKVLGKIAEGVLEGLTYLSGRKIIHRDIKPSNILLCRNGQVKLCDFGVSGELLGSKGDANTFIGTSYYMAPERIQGLSYTITSDVWSLGVTLMEVAQNKFPFLEDGGNGQTPAMLIELLTIIVRKPIPELQDERGIKWSHNFKYFLACCLEKDTARRASPWRMLEHPWIVEMKNKKVNMYNFLAQVWEWE
ncbi:Pkinase-domain-containing protein [Terfezia boudieri ATCC MYA-4762]|uniref:Pkinase-domain-containing protein n=1 Tax=Terfezia boudieri ATCC MYA-4762 TaxID=1051890 RepID=A0A3N4LMT1_9PEZI|nr:Pkinase-domain-containing protein [Terfezia boudieri ATCC MYA-4762]